MGGNDLYEKRRDLADRLYYDFGVNSQPFVTIDNMANLLVMILKRRGALSVKKEKSPMSDSTYITYYRNAKDSAQCVRKRTVRISDHPAATKAQYDISIYENQSLSILTKIW